MANSYWNRFSQQRVSRRRALAVSGGTVLGASFLAACGGDDGDDGGQNADTGGQNATGGQGQGQQTPTTSELVYKPVDQTSQAVKGGIMPGSQTTEPLHYDLLTTGASPIWFHAYHAYQRLVSLRPGTFDEPTTGEPEPDAASGWELSPDGLRLTFKLRENKFDPRPPTNGRIMTTDDVKWSWERFTELNPARRIFQNDIAPDSPVSSLSFPDESTVVVDLAFPMGAIVKMFGTRYYMAIYPTEAEGEFDPKQEMRGSGPWMLTNWEPSVGWDYERNPNWYKAEERPFLDGLRYTLIPDASTREAQFLSKNLWQLDVNPDLVTTFKSEQPEVDVLPSSPFVGQAGQNYWVPSRLPGSIWDTEVRLRHAFSMALDRDAFIGAVNNVQGLRDAGIPVEVGWHSHVPTYWPDVWLDPQSSDFGENAKYLTYNPEEAAKLLQAAGLFGHEEIMHFASNGLFGGERENSIASEMLNRDGLFNITLRNTDYATEYVTMIQNHAQHEGIASFPLGSWSDWDLGMWNTFTPSGRNDYVAHDTPELKDLMVKHRRELDPESRLEIVHEWQRAMAEHMVIIPFPGAATSFSLAWPWMGNRGWYQVAGGGVAEQETLIHIWHDSAKDTSTS